METSEEFLYLALEVAITAILVAIAISIGKNAVEDLNTIIHYAKNDIINMINFIKLCGCFIIF